MFRRLPQLALAALASLTGVAPLRAAEGPVAAAVMAVESTAVADLVLLDGGFNRGLRQGMLCRLMRGNTEIAEIVLVDLRPTVSAALLTGLSARQSVRAGDTARLKLLKS